MGIGANKLISKIITNVIPDNIHEVTPGMEDRFLAPLSFKVLPTARLKPVCKVLYFLLIDRIAQLQTLSKRVDDFSYSFWNTFHSTSKRNSWSRYFVSKTTYFKRSSIRTNNFAKNTNSEDMLLSAVQDLSEKIAFILRERGQVSKNIRLEIHYIDGFSSSKVGGVDHPDDASVGKKM